MSLWHIDLKITKERLACHEDELLKMFCIVQLDYCKVLKEMYSDSHTGVTNSVPKTKMKKRDVYIFCIEKPTFSLSEFYLCHENDKMYLSGNPHPAYPSQHSRRKPECQVDQYFKGGSRLLKCNKWNFMGLE